MNKRIFSLVLIFMLCCLMGVQAFAASSIIVNLGSITAGEPVELLVGSTDSGTAQCTVGSLPHGITVQTEVRDDGEDHYIKGTASVAGNYQFRLTVCDSEGLEISSLDCSLSVQPAAPSVTAGAGISCFVGDISEISVSAFTADNGSLSYQWYSGTVNSTAHGTAIENAVAPQLYADTGRAGTVYYYCVVSNNNNGLIASTVSPVISVNVQEVKPSSLSISVMPAKHEYQQGETLDLSGLQLLLKYNNGSSETVSQGFEASPMKLDTLGTQSVTITYQGLSCTYPVLVNEAKEVVEKIELISGPVKTKYSVGDWFDPTGIKLLVTTNKGSKEVDSGFSCDPNVLMLEGGQSVTVSYGGVTLTFFVEVMPDEKKVESISISRRPTKLSYVVGDEFDPTGLVLKVVTNMGVEEVDEGYTLSTTKLSYAGAFPITITYEGKTCTLDLVVEEAKEKPEASLSPIPEEKPQLPQASEKPEGVYVPSVEVERDSNPLLPIIIIASIVALAALGAFAYVQQHDRIKEFFDKLFRK